MEDETFRTESVYYAVNLAKRINCSASVLMLTEYSDDENARFASKQKIVEKILDLIRAEGVSAQGISRYGDKASGLLKHLATYSSFEAIIWGGKKEITSKHNMQGPDHWLAKIRKTIRCPVVSPTKKT
ncbi:MAG: hypothetical protein HN580_14430 [Deltaproteobacteria bacterium]|uniref:hypothetical protein n=1 Tax=Desulfobacula sp. TaxID=2593537 RepID=UPI001DEA15AD|nr:hypothetical protein [Deltaproteobacteria bacterium]MBT7631958.1 hypothetical protein [Desulfobacula sp.]MBT4644029.1 hypothetical protein [Deltaproteobacteria bacterium]MBT6615741.1 hypothetical protein [Deltaproteobacteria bacterium]MBT7152673.1 hypothetical protein [Deltaproteobacteria bacterium]